MSHDELFELGSSYEEMLQQGIRLSGEGKDFFIDGRVDHLVTRIPDGSVSSILDFACGTGDASSRLADAFGARRVLGVDIAAGAVEEARTRSQDHRVEFALLDDLPTEPDFDLCYVNGAYHHIPPPERLAVTRRIRQALRPGGSLAIFENNPWSIPARLVMRRIPFDRDAQMLRPATTRKLLVDAGFAVESRPRYLFFFPTPLRMLRRFEPRLAPVPAGAQYVVIGRKP